MSILIEEQDVTAVNLAVELERAVIEHILDEDKSIYITEDGWFPFWIRVIQRSGYVSFKTHTNFKRATSHLKRLEICNELNKSKYMLTCYEADDRLCIDYVLNYRNGLLRETFVRSCRQFSKNIESGFNEVDADNNFVLLPGRTEPEDETGDEKKDEA